MTVKAFLFREHATGFLSTGVLRTFLERNLKGPQEQSLKKKKIKQHP